MSIPNHIENAIPERLVPGTLAWDMYAYEHKQRYEFFASKCHGLSVLDAACGVGYGSYILAKAGAKSVVGVDISIDAVLYAQMHFCHPDIHFVRDDLENISTHKDLFDVVVSFETIEHLREPCAFISQVHSVLRPGGLFICSTPNKEFSERGTTSNPYHLNEMKYHEFVSVFEEGFEVEERYHQSHSAAYRRHIQLLVELGELTKPIRFSKLLRLENFIRRSLGREVWAPLALSPKLSCAVQGDYIIEPLEKPLDTHLTFILVGRAKT